MALRTRQFAGARGIAGQQQAGDVGAGDQQNQNGRAHQDQQGPADVAGVVAGPKGAGAVMLAFRAGIDFRQVAHDGVEIGTSRRRA